MTLWDRLVDCKAYKGVTKIPHLDEMILRRESRRRQLRASVTFLHIATLRRSRSSGAALLAAAPSVQVLSATNLHSARKGRLKKHEQLTATTCGKQESKNAR
jgi:hypothetical protein